METNKKDIKATYKNIYTKVETPEELREKVLGLTSSKRKYLSAVSKAALVAAAVLLSIVLSNLITWAAAGKPWIITVSDSLFNRELEKMEERITVPDEESFKSAEVKHAEEEDKTPEETEDIYSRLNIETYAEGEAPEAENDDPEGVRIKGDLSDEQLDALWEANEKRFQEEQKAKCNSAVENGYVYLFEMILDYDENFELPIHDYRYIKAFSKEELEGAKFSEDYEWIKIQDENYHVMISHVGDFKELDSEMPDLEWETIILRVFTEENYLAQSEIRTIEGIEYFRKNLALPIWEGRVAAYSNEDNSFIRTFTETECRNAEISENFQVVRIAGELYMVTYQLTEDGNATESIKLYPPEGYKGDARTDGIEEMDFYTMADFNLLVSDK